LKQRRLGTYGGAKHGVFINGELRASIAYKTLSHAARLLLIDWVSRYMKQSHGDVENLRATGMTFAYADCTEVMNESTFKEARQAIIERGFFECLPSMQSIIPGSRRVYVPSVKWKTYQPTAQEARRLATATKAREAALMKWNKFKEQREKCRHE